MMNTPDEELERAIAPNEAETVRQLVTATPEEPDEEEGPRRDPSKTDRDVIGTVVDNDDSPPPETIRQRIVPTATDADD